jgi:hypothetical protein
VSGLRHRSSGPHEELVRAGGAPESRPHGTGVRARGQDAPEQAQARHQAPAEKGRARVAKKCDAFIIIIMYYQLQSFKKSSEALSKYFDLVDLWTFRTN